MADVDGEFVCEVGEGAEIVVGDAGNDALTFTGLAECHATAFEAGTAEAASVDSIGMKHDVVESFQFRRTSFPVVDA